VDGQPASTRGEHLGGGSEAELCTELLAVGEWVAAGECSRIPSTRWGWRWDSGGGVLGGSRGSSAPPAVGLTSR
jgi:hypothetical protein